VILQVKPPLKCNKAELPGVSQTFVLVVLGNSSSRPIGVNPLYFIAATDRGVVYAPDFISLESERSLQASSGYGALQLFYLDPDKIAVGWLVFRTPPGTAFDVLTYDNRLGAHDTVSFDGRYCA
jgi:hypothetical protein